jgi:biofilm protein TabA
MIYDTFDNSHLYFDKADLLHKALSFVSGFDTSQPDGRYDIDGDNIYAMVMTYDTRSAEALKFEAHKKYIDIQLLLEGVEFLDVSLPENCQVDTPYSEQDDVMFFGSPQNFTSVLLEPGNFAVLYPHDIHRPCRMVKDKKQIRKMVLKVRVK